MTDNPRVKLERLEDSELTLANEAEDVRGRTAVDRNGDEIGKVEDLMIAADDDDNDSDARVRFIQVGAGGFLGIGEHKFLIPVDAIQDIDTGTVHIDETRDRITEGPVYDPDTVHKQEHWERAYNYYGYAPFWTVGYAYPAYPFYGAQPNPPGRPPSAPSSTVSPH